MSQTPPRDTGSDANFGEGLRHVRLVVELLSQSSREDVDAIADLLDPDFRVLAIPGLAPAKGYHSREDFLGYFEGARGAGQTTTPDLKTLEVLANGSVLVEGALRISWAHGTDILPAWFVYSFRNDRIHTLGNYLNATDAREATNGP